VNKLQEFNALFGTEKPIVGMVHLPPLPGSPFYDGTGLGGVVDKAMADVDSLVYGGVDAIQVENYHDPSYFVNEAAYETVAAMSIVAEKIRERNPNLAMGICLLADPYASIAVAHCVRAQFIRATFFSEASVDVGGLVLRSPHKLLRYRKFLDPSIKIFADVLIKHSAPLVMRPIEDSAYDAAYFCADAVIISGKRTGGVTDIEDVKKVKELLPNYPVMVGSGLNVDNAETFFRYADGSFVGSSLKVDGDADNDVDKERVAAFMERMKSLRA